jgi:phage terminase small subunit
VAEGDNKLTAKQDMFCKEYLIDLNATQACIRAGYKPDNAKQMATENLSKPIIADYIQELFDARSKKVEISAEWVLKGIKELTDKLVDSDDPSKAYKGYELGGKHLKLFTDRIELEAEVKVHEIQRKIVT